MLTVGAPALGHEAGSLPKPRGADDAVDVLGKPAQAGMVRIGVSCKYLLETSL